MRTGRGGYEDEPAVNDTEPETPNAFKLEPNATPSKPFPRSNLRPKTRTYPPANQDRLNLNTRADLPKSATTTAARRRRRLRVRSLGAALRAARHQDCAREQRRDARPVPLRAARRRADGRWQRRARRRQRRWQRWRRRWPVRAAGRRRRRRRHSRAVRVLDARRRVPRHERARGLPG